MLQRGMLDPHICEWTLSQACIDASDACVSVDGVEVEAPQVDLVEAPSARERYIGHARSEELCTASKRYEPLR